ncbi:MFS transporter [Pseudoalteromonas luteoviolacea]|uniref:MFS transporter n=1 Tax=Pseudoalteromonas luteoviolacea TaxID=43657 RepID=A0A1C0TR04_9GAMM|nr:MFS transporter [Pseudoalteromonas luteoviolacea]MBQ4811638.1 MFS transporter [Pseudoalteromonas luteoviolacea]OCQ21378.1 MFS transporter [Pseudoalteromonas luteoviolacea]
MKKNLPAVGMVLATFFVISFFTNILGPIFPELIRSFDIGLALAGFFPFAFFAAYGVMSIPAGLLVQRTNEKIVILLAFAISAIGALLFAIFPSFEFAMAALFLIGSAMALLQVSINPLLRRCGGSQHFALLSVVAQLMFGAGATLSPVVYLNLSDLAQDQSTLLSTIVPETMGWLSMYWLFAMMSFVMLVWVAGTQLEHADTRSEQSKFTWHECVALFKNPTVVKFFFAIAAYVALEQGIANSIGVFLYQTHALDTKLVGATVVSEFWMMLTVGCFVGLALMKLYDVRKLISWFCIGTALSLSLAIMGTAEIAVIAFPMAGFFLSILWSGLFSLALNSFEKGHGAIAGILCTGIIGGAIASPIIGLFAQVFGSLKMALFILLLPTGYILYVASVAKPIVNNHTIRLFSKKPSEQEA